MAFLRAMRGLEPGSICTLREGSTTFGRNANCCDVVLKHFAVSREHAVIQVTPEGTFIEDLGSRNGVLVNGVPLKPGSAGRRRLSPRDRIHLAAFEFVYHEDHTTDAMAVVDETSTDSGILSTVDVSSDSSRIVLKNALQSPAAPSQADVDTRRTVDVGEVVPEAFDDAWKRLAAMLSIIEQTGGTIDAAEAPMVILDSLFRSFPQTESGCVLLKSGSRFTPAAIKTAKGAKAAPRISQAILNYVEQNKRAVLSGDAHSDSAFSLSESAASLRIRSIMCVPLVNVSGEVAGIIELETSKTKDRYTETDLAVLAGVARHLAIVIENAQLHATMLRDQRAAYEERFRKLVEGSIQGVLIHRDFEPLFVNEAWAALHGYSVDEVLDMDSVLPLVAPEDRERMLELANLRKVNPSAENRYEVRGLRRDGRVIWLEEFATVVDWEDGPAIQNTVIDLTERKAAEAVLRQDRDEMERRVAERTSELAEANEQLQQEIAERQRAEWELQESFALYHSLVDHIPLCVVRKSVDGKFTFVNRALCKLFGVPAEAMRGKTDFDLFSHEQAEKYRQADEEVMRTGGQLELFETVPLPNGEELQIHTLKTPIYDVEGNVIGTQLIFWDITEQKQLEDERNRYGEELERSNRDLEQFAYNVSHDLQSPLRTITSYCQLLQKATQQQLDEVSKEYLANAISGTKRMKRLLDDLLEYSRISTKPRELTSVDMEETLKAVLSNLAAAIRENHAIVSHDPLPTVIGDPTQLVQLLQNLINNAMKYRRNVAPRIHISVEDNGDEWHFSVSDNGEGIDPQNFERIFHIFQRLHTEKDRPGAGIGLSICKRIVERHGGDMWLESNRGEGSVFYFSIPKRPARND